MTHDPHTATETNFLATSKVYMSIRTSSGVGVAVQYHPLEEAIVDSFLKTVCLHNFGEHFSPNVRRAGVVVTGHNAGAFPVEAAASNTNVASYGASPAAA